MGIIGLKIGDEFSGDIIGLSGYTLKITGGTDKDGFPMHPSVEGVGRKKILLSSPPCFHPKRKGERRRKMVRGNTISQDIVQINCKVVKKGEKPLEELIPSKKTKEVEKEVEKEKPVEKPEKAEKEQAEKKEEKAKEPEEKKPEKVKEGEKVETQISKTE